jgi:hypothetical protein
MPAGRSQNAARPPACSTRVLVGHACQQIPRVQLYASGSGSTACPRNRRSCCSLAVTHTRRQHACQEKQSVIHHRGHRGQTADAARIGGIGGERESHMACCAAPHPKFRASRGASVRGPPTDTATAKPPPTPSAAQPCAKMPFRPPSGVTYFAGMETRFRIISAATQLDLEFNGRRGEGSCADLPAASRRHVRTRNLLPLVFTLCPRHRRYSIAPGAPLTVLGFASGMFIAVNQANIPIGTLT